MLPHLGSPSLYVEGCCGGAALFWAKEPGGAEVLNDLDEDLVTFYRVLHRQGRRLAAAVDAMPYSRALFRRVLARRPRTLFGRAERFWYLNRVSFGGMGRTYGVKGSRRVSVLPARLLASLDAVIERLRGVMFECMDVRDLVRLYDRGDALFYIDPPYRGTSQPYACRLQPQQHEQLAACLMELQGRVLVSYDNHPVVRSLYAGWHMIDLRTGYSLGANSSSGRGRTDSSELLIANYPLRRSADET